MTIFEAKSSLRSEMIQVTRGLSAGEREEKSRLILDKLINHAGLKEGSVCGFYASLPSEPDLSGLLTEKSLSGVRFCIPRVNGSGMTFHIVTDFDESTSVSSKGIREPHEKAPRILPQEIDVLVIPALAYSKGTGHRLGRGGGYYDRYLRIPQTAQRIGVCFDGQIVDKVPVEKHDKQVEVILTDQQTIEI